ncbi:MAG: VTT domain-containing protein [Pseudomonadota bacterium]
MTSEEALETASGGRRNLWLAAGGIGLLAVILLVGKFGGFFDPVQLGVRLGEEIRRFADGPFGLPALIVAFCVCAFIAVPQVVLIGVAMFAFGPGLGSVYAWIATMCSGSLTYGLGRASGSSVMSRVSSKRLDAFASFVGRNAFLASAIVRNVPTGPFLFVNMAFGALRAGYVPYAAGMALGIIPKIALVGFAGKGIRAAVEGNPALAIMMGLAAVAVLAGGFLYVRHRRRAGNILSLSEEKAVDSGE